MKRLLNTGFTLVEISVTLIVLGAMSALAIPTYQKYVTVMKAEEGKTVLLTIMNAQKLYYADHKAYSTQLSDLKITFPNSPKGFLDAYLGSGSPYRYVPTIAEKNGLYTLRINLDGTFGCENAAGQNYCSKLKMSNTFENQWDPFSCPSGQAIPTACSGYAVPSHTCCPVTSAKWKGSCVASCGEDGDGGGNGCFLSGTQITMADGTQKSIESIKVGDIVLSYDEETKKMKPDKVVKTFFHPKDNYYGIINGQLKVTPNHSVLSKGKWVHIGNLRVGDTLTDVNGNDVVIKSIEVVREKSDVYNFEVNPTHTYVANGFVVHNANKTFQEQCINIGGCFWD